MNRKIIVQNKEYKMPKMSADTYMDYLDLSEQINADTKKGYNREQIEAMMLFICKAYGNQFTTDELKDMENGGMDITGIILEFQFIDMAIADEMNTRMEKIQKNFMSGK